MCKPRTQSPEYNFAVKKKPIFFFESFLGTCADDMDTTVTYHQQPYQQADITFDQHFDAIMSMLMGYLYVYTTSNTSLTT